MNGRHAVDNLLVVLGDQLDENSLLFESVDPRRAVVWMAEVGAESTHVPSHKARTALFLSAMRHFAARLVSRGWDVRYHKLDDPAPRESLGQVLADSIVALRPRTVRVVEPGEHRVKQELERATAEAGVELQVLPDRHFYCSIERFKEHAEGRKQLRMEFFYREMRQEHGVFMDGKSPVGGQWNFDEDNRESFGRDGPGLMPAPIRFEPDAITREVIELVQRRFPDNPGSLEHFDWPVTQAQALAACKDFIRNRLPWFGQYQDAIWTGEPWLYHSRLSAAMNLKLLDPRVPVGMAEDAYRQGRVSAASAEGFIRQILGWREYVRGIYWLHMPGYDRRNALHADQPLPWFYWTGKTDMKCLADAIGQTLEYGYAHHIQRLMVTGLFAMLLGVDPHEVHRWYLAVYVDAVEWVELPNTLGMSQFGDGGVMASKPYCATGKYIQRMSNACGQCRYDPALSTGPQACPFTTLYWDFLHRHREALGKNPRMAMQLKNLRAKSAEQMDPILRQAESIRQRLRVLK